MGFGEEGPMWKLQCISTLSDARKKKFQKRLFPKKGAENEIERKKVEWEPQKKIFNVFELRTGKK